MCEHSKSKAQCKVKRIAGGGATEGFVPALPQTFRVTAQLTRPGARTPPRPSPASSQAPLGAAASPGLPSPGTAPGPRVGDHREAPGAAAHQQKGAFLAELACVVATRAPSRAASWSQL